MKLTWLMSTFLAVALLASYTPAGALTHLRTLSAAGTAADAKAAEAASKTAGATKTQGKCACLSKWTYKYNATSSVTLSGCANPDQDHKGDWCPVNEECIGQYGNFTWLGETVHFDYCGAVRGVTLSGCLCNAVSDSRSLAAPQKPTYDGCSNRDSSPSSWCYVNNRTCATPLVEGDRDAELCKIQSELAVENIIPDGTLKTQGGCTCLPNWGYIQEPKYGPLGPFKGCYSGDNDPKGSWCQVNPVDCPASYGSFKQNQPVYFDYCNNVSDFTRAGCRCKPIWGGGKLMDRCANPDGKPGGKWCEVMPGTCSKGTPEGKDWDYCGPGPVKPNSTLTANTTSNATDGGVKSSSGTAGSSAAPIVVVAPAPKSEDKSRRIVVIVVPILTGLAAIVTIMYTLYKCHKKRKFFQSSQLMKMQQYNNASQLAAGGSGAGGPHVGHAQGSSSGYPLPIAKDTV